MSLTPSLVEVSAKKMAKKIKVSKQFLNDFELVTKHYKMPADEIEWLKNKARESYDEVCVSLKIIAGNIRSGSC